MLKAQATLTSAETHVLHILDTSQSRVHCGRHSLHTSIYTTESLFDFK